MIYKLTLHISGEELAKDLDLMPTEIVDDRDEAEIMGAIRDFGHVAAFTTEAE